MMRKTILFLLLPIMAFSQVSSILKACPTCYGPGSIATGGRNGILYIVDTLNDETPAVFTPASGNDAAYYRGGLQDALVTHDVGPIVFEVSGYIDIGQVGTRNWPEGTTLGIYSKNKTIYGQSAPRGGITITGGTFDFGGYNSDQGNMIIQHIRSRPRLNEDGNVTATDDRTTWALRFRGGSSIMVTNVSGSFAHDKTFGGSVRQEHVTNGDCPCPLQDYTMQYMLGADSHTMFYLEVNPNRPNDPEELVDNIGIYGSVMIGTNRTANHAHDGDAEQINTIVLNVPNKNSRIYHDVDLNYIGNYLDGFSYNWIGTNESNGQDVPQVYARRNYLQNESININGYSSGNINLTGDTQEDNNILFINQARNAQASSENLASAQFNHNFPNPWPELTPQEAFAELIANQKAGAHLYMDDNGELQEYRDDFDTEMLNRAQNGTLGSYSFRNVGNWVLPPLPTNTRSTGYDTDNDGMADDWEVRVYGDLSQTYNGDSDGDGWTNLEEFIYQNTAGETTTQEPPIKLEGELPIIFFIMN